MISMPQANLKSNLFVKCLVLSACFHAGVAFYFYTHPFLFRPSWHSLFRLASAQPEFLEFEEDDLNSKAQNLALADVFERLKISSFHLPKPLDSVKTPEGLSRAPSLEEGIRVPELATEEIPSLIAEGSHTHRTTVSLPSFVDLQEESPSAIPLPPRTLSDPFASFSLTREPLPLALLPEEKIVNSEKKSVEWEPSVSGHPPSAAMDLSTAVQDKAATLALRLDTKTVLEASIPSLLPEVTKTIPLPQAPTAPEHRTILSATTSRRLESYELPSLAVAKAWKEYFNVDLQFIPDRDSDGYLFSIDISPKEGTEDQILKQNFYFILDRSYGIQKHKFAVFKRAVLKAISTMHAGESFNIYFLDKKGSKLADKPIPYSMKAVLAAEEFLEKQDIGTPFVPSNIYAALDHVLSEIPQEEEVHTAIVLTDGHTSLKPVDEQKALKRWLSKNQGKLSVYAAAVGQKNNLISLDLLSSASGGKLLYSDTHASFPRKLSKLILDLHDPIICDISLAALPTDENAQVVLSQASSHLPTFYSHRPYQIVGKIDRPCDFELIFKGRNQNEWVTIQESLSFSEGEELARADASKDLFQMHLLYAKFLREGGITPLKDAKEILKKSHDAVAFE